MNADVTRVENLNINNKELANGDFYLNSLPPVLFIELTQNCNLSCSMCRAADGRYKNRNMKDDLYRSISTSLFSTATLIDLRGFGESTILKDFENKLTIAATSGARIRLVTNALAIRPYIWRKLMEVGATVVVSVDASTKQTMHLLGRGSFEKLVGSLVAAKNENERAGGFGSIYFNTTVSSLNIREIKGIVALADNLDVRRITLFPIVTRRDNPLHLDNVAPIIEENLQEATALAINLNVELRLGASLDSSLTLEMGLPFRCSHPWQYCYIDYSGNVGYCDHLIGHTSLTLGNLTVNTFDEIWNGESYQELRRFHTKGRRGGTVEMGSAIPHCNWCYKRRYVDFEEVTNSTEGERIISTKNTTTLINNMANIDSSEFLKSRKILFP